MTEAFAQKPSVRRPPHAPATAADVMRPAPATIEPRGHVAGAAYLMKHGGVTVTSAGSRPRPGSTPRPDNHIIVLFGAAGDLARRRLLPGLFHLAAAGLMPDRYQIIGSSRRPLTDQQFRDLARQAVAEFGVSAPAGEAWQTFQRRLSSPARSPAAPPR
jgi:hypothetical protein